MASTFFLVCYFFVLNECTDISDLSSVLTDPSSSSQNTLLFFSIYGAVMAAIIISVLVLSLICRQLNCCCCKNYDSHEYDDHHDNVICYKITGYFNHLIEYLFEIIGILISKCPYLCCILVLIMTLTLSCGLFFIKFETNIFDLWTPTDSPIFDEREFIAKYWSQKDYGLNIITAISKAKDGINEDILTQNNLNEWFKFHINFRLNLPQKSYKWNEDNSEGVQVQHSVEFGYFADDLNEPVTNEIDLRNLGENYTVINDYIFSDIIPLCRPIISSYHESQLVYPCYIQQIFDCFNEGNVLFPYRDYLSKIDNNLLTDNPYLTKPSYKSLDTNQLNQTYLLISEVYIHLSGLQID